MAIFSETVNYNLTPLFEFWGLPLSEEAKASVSSLKAFFPDDEITQKYGPDQAAAILKKYPDVVRVPDSPATDEVHLEPAILRFEAITLHLVDEIDEDDCCEVESDCSESEEEKDEF